MNGATNIPFIVWLCVMIVILVTGVIGNSLVIFVIGYKMKTTVNSMWFLNLAITDLIFIPILVFSPILYSLERNNPLIQCVHYMFYLNMFASAFFLTVISLDRCLCTWCVVWAQNKRTLVKARIICGFVWLLAIYKPEDKFQDIKFELKHLSAYIFTVGFLIPFLIITSSYLAIVVRVRSLPRGNHLRIFRVIIVILVFFISWFPYHCLRLFILWNDSSPDNLYATFIFTVSLVFLNCVNPILYVFMCDEYKKKLKMSLPAVLEGAFTEDHLGLH
ncbi:C3a anaphylatoxin chemotactic receptor [Triplophysa tibetana]|uniref:C3a anaphylatoxin chemotactic receptor n=1 Tax=Triplophysa tibetana TaxID=1572043 RepID=A0A5A9MY20_9TELE|nr:C3a anaphylatoxin chemotactic receptor [Triplophysa tibetana]